jgi:hypothetical protein
VPLSARQHAHTRQSARLGNSGGDRHRICARHPGLARVALFYTGHIALTIPLRTGGGPPPLNRLDHALQPWSSFLIAPAFGFANAGLRLPARRTRWIR